MSGEFGAVNVVGFAGNKVVKVRKEDDPYYHDEDAIAAYRAVGQYVDHDGRTIVQKRQRGQTLGDYLRKQEAKHPGKEINVKPVFDAAVALQERVGFEHRDLNTGNIIVNRKGKFKTLVDWDNAKKIDPVAANGKISQHQVEEDLAHFQSQCHYANKKTVFERRDGGGGGGAAPPVACKLERKGNGGKKVATGEAEAAGKKKDKLGAERGVGSGGGGVKGRKRVAGAKGKGTGKGGGAAAARVGRKGGRGKAAKSVRVKAGGKRATRRGKKKGTAKGQVQKKRQAAKTQRAAKKVKPKQQQRQRPQQGKAKGPARNAGKAQLKKKKGNGGAVARKRKAAATAGKKATRGKR
ncbi:hypothetical protein DFJ73DRAFT_802135 [Zopfochytrium polystomum]|nr:hypothetical protein DFJ73DRAFT_802135 [Zopfochytrium polystomum]